MKATIFFISLCISIVFGACSVVDELQHGETAVNLSRKNLKVIPDYIYANKEIKILRLYGNSIDSISYRIGEMENLEELYIGKNNLKSLPKEIGNLKKLKILSLQYNSIDSIPPEIGHLVNLEQLILNQNELVFLPEEIGNLKKLEVLQLKYNWLVSLPETISNCENLQFLYLNRNNLQSLPIGMEKLLHLKELYLAGAGQLVEIPESLCELRHLEILEIDQTSVIPTCLLVIQTSRLTIIQR